MSPAALMWPVKAQAGQRSTVGVWAGTGAGWPLGHAPQRGLGPTLCLPVQQDGHPDLPAARSSPVLLPPQNPTLQVSTRRTFSLCPVWPSDPGWAWFPKAESHAGYAQKTVPNAGWAASCPVLRRTGLTSRLQHRGVPSLGSGGGPTFLTCDLPAYLLPQVAGYSGSASMAKGLGSSWQTGLGHDLGCIPQLGCLCTEC